jgi:very-short-patch-repair endonuclease
MCDFAEHVAITDWILHKGLATANELERAIKPGHCGLRNARRSLRAADSRAESPGETRMRLILHGAGIMVVSQYEILNDFGDLIARTDFALVELMIALEYDGGHHLDRDRQRRDLDRVRTMERRGWRVLRFGAEDLRDRQRQMIAEIRAAIRERGG